MRDREGGREREREKKKEREVEREREREGEREEISENPVVPSRRMSQFSLTVGTHEQKPETCSTF